MTYRIGKLEFDIPTRIAELDIAYDTITVQELVDTFRDFEDIPEAVAYGPTISAEGKSLLPDSSRTVITATLLNGWRLKFADRPGPTLEQGTVTGGNLLAVTGDLGSGTQFPIFPAANISVSLAQATTGALLGSIAPEYQGAVYVDAIDGQAGTAFPIGTPSTPVDNIVDALTIADEVGLRTLRFLSDVTVPGSVDLSGKLRLEAAGGGAVLTFLGSDITDVYFERVFLAGTVIGGDAFGIDLGFLDGLSGLRGTFQNAIIAGTVTLGGSVSIINGSSGVPGTGTSIIDGNNLAGVSIEMRRYTGGIDIRNIDDPNASVSIDLIPGRLILDPSVTAGTFKVRGIGEPVDNNGTPTVLDADGYLEADQVVRTRKLVEASETLAEGAGPGNYVKVDPDDGVTVLVSYTVLDKNGQPIAIPDGAPATRTRL